MATWDMLVDDALASLAARRLLFNTRLLALPPPSVPSKTFNGPGPWDRATVEIQLNHASLKQWLTINGVESGHLEDGVNPKAAQEYGMGPRGSSLICGYTTYHKLVEESLAELQKKEDCILCPTGFSANTALMTALGSISSLLSVGRKLAKDERIAIFSDALNHASTIDGIRLVERTHEAVAFVYKHCDMLHLDALLSSCSMSRKVVVTDRYSAIYVSKKEIWRRSVIWDHVRYFASLTNLDITSPIILIEVGSEEAVLNATRFPHLSKFS
ncbi:hypothetical protein PR202_gb08086 [Eleusine coracana subsp. coracana]|uniref:Aminotransferase class I/classII large domain-containing protein n=1 Tax=Eleusine coracana subsp. coracana TaxID=191504 RepID=A0AAV5EBA1_ELECO|nr:hypothetical protein PR202_gb08086 [Eleusine coracana subsp. coracana]